MFSSLRCLRQQGQATQARTLKTFIDVCCVSEEPIQDSISKITLRKPEIA